MTDDTKTEGKQLSPEQLARVTEVEARAKAATTAAAKRHWTRRLGLLLGYDTQRSAVAKVLSVHKTNRSLRRVEIAKKKREQHHA